jgi:hypothetical protein
MENTKKRVGRPKVEPPKGPLVLEGIQKRETILTEVSVDVAQELGDYAAWVKESAPAKMTAAEATSKTVDYALRDTFRRDQRWQDKKRGVGRPQGTAGDPQPTPASVTPRPAPSSPSLPPPISRDPRTTS